MVSIGFISLPSVGVSVEAVRLVKPVVEEVKVNKQLMADARFKGVAGWTHELCLVGRLQS